MRQPGITSFRIASIAIGALASLAFANLAPGGQTTRASQPSEKGKRVFAWNFIGRGGFLGVEVLPLTKELRVHFGAPEDAGVLVARVEENSPAAAAGIQVGDVLTAVDGAPIAGPPSLAHAVREKKAGESVNLDFIRDASALSASVTVDERDRKVIDLADFEVAVPEIAPFPGMGPIEGSHGFVFSPEGQMKLDPEAFRAFEEAMQNLGGRFASEEWQEKMKKFQELDLGKIQERMKEVEDRLRKLESELDKEGKKKL
jgi:membrane-associated protease RseP (regulator of RpoE activity)